jgi:hypothetical protein
MEFLKLQRFKSWIMLPSSDKNPGKTENLSVGTPFYMKTEAEFRRLKVVIL